MKKHLTLWGILVLSGLLLAGCKKDTVGPDTPSAMDETTALKSIAANDPFVQNDEVAISDGGAQPENYGTYGKVDVSIIPFLYGRKVENVERTTDVTVLPGDSIAIVTVKKKISGIFLILAKNLPTDTTLRIVQKPFVDNATRRLIMKRINRYSDRPMMNWIPVATSLVRGETEQSNLAADNKIHIAQLEFYMPNDTVVITNPDTTFLRYRWTNMWMTRTMGVPEVRSGSSLFVLRATVVSTSPDTDCVALRVGFHRSMMGGFYGKRVRMVLVSQADNGDGSYTRVYSTPSLMYLPLYIGSFHVGVDAVTKATIFDDQVAYSASWWGIPYRAF